jgi:hypothetical protein
MVQQTNSNTTQGVRLTTADPEHNTTTRRALWEDTTSAAKHGEQRSTQTRQQSSTHGAQLRASTWSTPRVQTEHLLAKKTAKLIEQKYIGYPLVIHFQETT